MHVSPQNNLQTLSPMLLKINLLKNSQSNPLSVFQLQEKVCPVSWHHFPRWCWGWAYMTAGVHWISGLFLLSIFLSSNCNKNQKGKKPAAWQAVIAECWGPTSPNCLNKSHLWPLPTNSLPTGLGAAYKVRLFSLTLFEGHRQAQACSFFVPFSWFVFVGPLLECELNPL